MGRVLKPVNKGPGENLTGNIRWDRSGGGVGGGGGGCCHLGDLSSRVAWIRGPIQFRGRARNVRPRGPSTKQAKTKGVPESFKNQEKGIRKSSRVRHKRGETGPRSRVLSRLRSDKFGQTV